MKNDYDPMQTVIWVVLFLLAALIVCWLACRGVEAGSTDKDGRVFWYKRTGAQQIGEVLLEFPDGTMFLMDGQKSELPPVKITATSIIIGKER